MHLVTLNAAGKPLAPVRALDPRRRRLSQVIGRHVDRSRPHMIAVQRARDPLQPIEEAWVLRGRDRTGEVKPWPRMFLPADAIVVVVYLPRGGGGASSRGGGGKGIGSIALAIAAVALVVFSGPIGTAAAAAIGLGATAASVISAGVVLGATALLSLASRAKANKQATDTTQIYGVAGGGNQPKPGDRIPRGYGRSWMKPDLSQPDFSQYDGDDQILFKRHTLGVGRYRPYQVRAGKQVIWTEAGGFQAPFDDARNAIEFIHGQKSELVPGNVVSASGIGGLLPRPEDHPTYAGPFLINQRGALVSRLQIDFQFPQGISRVQFFKSGSSQSNLPAAWSVMFEYAPIDESGAEIGPWQELYYGNSGAEGARFATRPLRYTRFKDVPPGRYAVRGWNVQPDTSQATVGNASIDACQWDAASGWVGDTAVRDGITEMALRLYATKATQAAAIGEVEIDAAAIIPVWTGSAWEEQETSKAVWAFLDIMRDQDYGGALGDDRLDVETARAYAARLTEFDTFDGTIRGPVSVYEAAAAVLLPMRAEPVHNGRLWSLVRDEPKAVRRHVITRRQILKGSSQVSFDLDTASGAGHVIGEFDQDGDYRNPNQTLAIYGEASLTPTRQRWTGVRTFAHAQHLTRWRAASGAYRRQSAPFGVEMEGRIYRRGDSIAVDQWFTDVRKVAGVLDAAGDALSLDADVPAEAGDAVTLRDRTGREWGPVTIAGRPSVRVIVLDAASRGQVEAATGVSLASALSDGRGEMTTVLVGTAEVLTENYLIQSVKPSGPDRAQVEALIDDARVWAAIGAPIVVPPVGGSGLADPESPRVLGLSATATQMTAGLRLDFAIRPGRGAASFEVGLSYDDGAQFETIYAGPSIEGSHPLNPVEPTTVRLRARAFGATGLPGTYFYTPLDLGRSVIVDPELETRFDDVARLIREGAALGERELRAGLLILLDVTRELDGRLEEMAQAAATEAGSAYEARQFNKVALEGRVQDNFAAIERETKLRISQNEALSTVTTTLGSRLTNAEGTIVGQATALQGITTRVTNAEGTITAQSQSITSLTTRITNAETGLSGQATATSQLTTRVSSAEGSITSLSQSYTALNATVATQGNQIGGNATAINNVAASVHSINGQISAQASSITTLNSQVGTNSATISTQASTINGIQAQFAVTIEQNGQTGGFALVGARRLDGGFSTILNLRGDLIVDGSIFGRALAAQQITTDKLTTGQLIVNGQIFNNAVSTIDGVESSNIVATGRFTFSRASGQTKLAIIAFFNPGGVVTVPNAGSVGTLDILINGGLVATKASNSVPGNSGFYIIGDSIMKQINIANGTHEITAKSSNAGGGMVNFLFIELSK